MVKKIAPIVIIILLLAAFFFYKLGGGEPLQYTLKPSQKLIVAGADFTGKYNSSKAEKLFFQAKNAADADSGLNLTVINYFYPELKDSVVQFIGVSSSEKPMMKSIYFSEERTFDTADFVFVEIKAHNFVMPKPEEVRNGAEQFAKEKGVKLEPISIEIYKGERQLDIYFPISK